MSSPNLQSSNPIWPKSGFKLYRFNILGPIIQFAWPMSSNDDPRHICLLCPNLWPPPLLIITTTMTRRKNSAGLKLMQTTKEAGRIVAARRNHRKTTMAAIVTAKHSNSGQKRKIRIRRARSPSHFWVRRKITTSHLSRLKSHVLATLRKSIQSKPENFQICTFHG